MAIRPVYFVSGNIVHETEVEFEWFAGFSVSQKRRSIDSLHEAVRRLHPGASPLEISTKSAVPLGNKLSAFNLRLGGVLLESVFQSSKIFDDGTGLPHTEWLALHPRDAKAVAGELHSQGLSLTAFCYNGLRFPLEPKTVFYDYIYILAVRESLTEEEIHSIPQYDHFTDIEFNPKRSINTQARTCALIRLMLTEFGSLPELPPQEFIEYHKQHIVY